MNAEEQLFNEYEYLVKITVNKMFANPRHLANSKGLSYDDFLQYGRMGLWDACKTWEQKQLGIFRNYAIRNIKWKISKMIEKEQMNQSYYRYYQKKDDGNKRITLLSMNHKPFGEEVDKTFYDVVASDNINKFNSDDVESEVFSNMKLNALLSKLNNKEKEMVKLKMNDYTHQEIADHYGVSRQAIQQKFKRMLAKYNNSLGVVEV